MEKFYWIIVSISYTIAAFVSLGYLHPDEHFQILEPVNKIVYGEWILSWELFCGERSWFLPYLYAGPLMVLKWLNLDVPSSNAIVLRLITAVFSLLKLAYFYKILEFLSLSEFTKKTIFLFYALFFWSITLSVRTSSENWSEIFIVISLYYFLAGNRVGQKSNRYYFIGSILAGFAFMARFQTALFFMGFVICLMIDKKYKAVVLSSIGFLFVFLFQVILDYGAYGEFSLSPIRYFIIHAIYNKASEWGVYPWYQAVILVGLYFGVIIFIPILYFCIRGFLKEKWIAIPALLFFIFHSITPHKEFRFFFPLIPFIYLLCALGMGTYEKKVGYIVRSLMYVNIIIALFLAAMLKNHNANPDVVFSKEIERDHKNKNRNEPAFLIYEHPDMTALPPFYLQNYIRLSFRISGFTDPRGSMEIQKIHTTDEVQGLPPIRNPLSFKYPEHSPVENEIVLQLLKQPGQPFYLVTHREVLDHFENRYSKFHCEKLSSATPKNYHYAYFLLKKIGMEREMARVISAEKYALCEKYNFAYLYACQTD